MGFPTFIALSLFYAVIGIRVVFDLARHWRATFDRQFTSADRVRVDQAAFFLLVPISVALHELGHAVAVWSYGGRVTDYGFYIFAGFVAYQAPFTATQAIMVAAAGTAVNVLLIALALGLVLLRRPPMRPALNELLIQFVIVSGLNALVAYPALDLATGLNGDFHQIYFGGEPSVSVAILAVQVGLLALGWWAWHDPRLRGWRDALTAVPIGAVRRPLGGLRAASAIADGSGEAMSTAARQLVEAGQRVAAGWPQPVQTAMQRTAAGPALSLVWQLHGHTRAVAARAQDDGVAVWGAVAGEPDLAGAARMPERRSLAHLPPTATADSLTLALRLAMEEVARWPDPVGTGSP